jgi:hypothetical protein
LDDEVMFYATFPILSVQSSLNLTHATCFPSDYAWSFAPYYPFLAVSMATKFPSWSSVA